MKVLTSPSLQSKKFIGKIKTPLRKSKITVLQINLGRRCNLACSHCHVEAGPHRHEELSPKVLSEILEILDRFPQIETVDLTGGAPEMNFGFREIVTKARTLEKHVIVRSNLTIFFETGFDWVPDFLAENKVRIVASLPCYKEENVDKMRGDGVFSNSIKALKILNDLGFGKAEDLKLDLVYNPPIPFKKTDFRLAPNQEPLQVAYKKFLGENFGVVFGDLMAITNLPIGRFVKHLAFHKLESGYVDFLSHHYNSATLPGLMCKNQLSIDYDGDVFDCDFNQIERIAARDRKGEKITLKYLLEKNSLDIIEQIPVRNFCFGCTAGSGSSCGGQLTSETLTN